MTGALSCPQSCSSRTCYLLHRGQGRPWREGKHLKVNKYSKYGGMRGEMPLGSGFGVSFSLLCLPSFGSLTCSWCSSQAPRCSSESPHLCTSGRGGCIRFLGEQAGVGGQGWVPLFPILCLHTSSRDLTNVLICLWPLLPSIMLRRIYKGQRYEAPLPLCQSPPPSLLPSPHLLLVLIFQFCVQKVQGHWLPEVGGLQEAR